jgi:TRAP transporter TAXI family solute receptor
MRRFLPSTTVEFVKVWSPLLLLVVIGFVVAYQYVGAPPPRRISMAAGPRDGAYYRFARDYAERLAGDGITLDVVTTMGSVENLELLRRGDVSLAFVQGGTASEQDRRELQALGSLFLEPVWVLTRSTETTDRLTGLAGRRIAIGSALSGTHRLAERLLEANGITAANATLETADTAEALRRLSSGTLDAAMFVAAAEAPFLRNVLADPSLALLDFGRAPAYGRTFPFLTPVVLREGVLDLARDIPPRDTRLVASAATLAARPDLNPKVIPAVLDAVTRVHEKGGVFEEPRQFPSADLADLPMHPDARRYIRDGPSFLYRWLPYGSAVALDRLKVLLLPLVALLLPLFRIGPPLYQWRVRSKIYRWYGAVRDIDLELLADRIADVADLRARLRTLEREVADVQVPLSSAGEQYHLRLHIRLLQERLDALGREGDALSARAASAGPPA